MTTRVHAEADLGGSAAMAPRPFWL